MRELLLERNPERFGHVPPIEPAVLPADRDVLRVRANQGVSNRGARLNEANRKGPGAERHDRASIQQNAAQYKRQGSSQLSPQGISALNDAKHDHNDGNDQEQVDQPAHRVGGGESEHPEYEKNSKQNGHSGLLPGWQRRARGQRSTRADPGGWNGHPREFDGEHAPDAWAIACVDSAVVRFNSPAAEGEAKTQPASIGALLSEWLKEC